MATTRRLKTQVDIRQLVKSGEIQILSSSESGELTYYGIKSGSFTYAFPVHFLDYGEDYEVVESERSISKQNLHNLDILFESEVVGGAGETK